MPSIVRDSGAALGQLLKMLAFPTTASLQGNAFGQADDIPNADLEFYVDTDIEPFDRLETGALGYLQLKAINIHPDPNETRNTWQKGLSRSWLSAAVPSFSLTSGVLNLGVLPAFDQSLAQSGFRIVGKGNTGLPPIVTAQHYRAGSVPGTYPQQIHFFGAKVYKDHYNTVKKAVDAYVWSPAGMSAIRTAYNCPTSQNATDCLCTHYNEMSSTAPYTPAFKQIAAKCLPDGGDLNNVCYPIQFIYTLPGTQQVTTNYIINIEKN